MKLYQVRKGQFVFYENELHKVYSVKPMFRQSVHLYRLKDMEQILTRAADIELYRPKHNDTFIFYGQRYTIDQYKKPEIGDYILITKPAPDLFDHYSLNEIEKVEKIDENSVRTTRDNAVKHHEYVVLVPGQSEASQEIAYYDKELVPEEQRLKDESISYLAEKDVTLQPYVGDIYLDKRNNTKAMVVAVTESEVTFGHGIHVHIAELLDEDSFELIYRYSVD